MPQNTDLLPEYNECWAVTTIFNVFASTVTTARNDFAMAYDASTLVKRVDELRDTTQTDQSLRDRYNLKDVSYWTLPTARLELAAIKDVASYVKPYCYRPFDFRYVFYQAAICERLRLEAMSHMKGGNLAFLTHRPQSPGDFTFAYCTRMIGDQCVAANKSAGGGNSFQFPLYTYANGKKTDLFAEIEAADVPEGRKPNLAPNFVKAFADKLGMMFIPDGHGDGQSTFGPEDVFDYLYAVFHSPTYRSRYAEFLKSDFPRLPLTSQPGLFRALCALGSELVGLHLMEKKGEATVNFPVALPKSDPAKDTVEGVRYAEPTESDQGRVYINKAQYFDGIPPAVWAFQVGGYQVCQKWLKDRKGRTLTFDDIKHYQGIVAALGGTIRLMEAIDEAIDDHGGWPLA